MERTEDAAQRPPDNVQRKEPAQIPGDSEAAECRNIAFCTQKDLYITIFQSHDEVSLWQNRREGKENRMFEVFGEMDSAGEINAAAEGLKNEGDKENLCRLARENGIDTAFAEMYFEGDMETLCDVAAAAIGKIEAEAAELNPVEIVADWVEYIKASCLDDEELARAVRKRGKNLKGCIGSMLAWSFRERYKVDKDIVKAAGINNASVEMGIPGMGRAKKLIREYYLGKGGETA